MATYRIDAVYTVARTYLCEAISEDDARRHTERWEKIEEVTLERDSLEIMEEPDDD